MHRRAVARITALTSLAMLAGCATAKKAYHRASEDLKDAVRAYNEALRIGDVDAATAFIPAPDRPAFLETAARLLKEVRFTDVKVGQIEFPQGSSEATVTVTRSYYRLDELTEKQESLNQVWLWSAKEVRWRFRYAGRP